MRFLGAVANHLPEDEALQLVLEALLEYLSSHVQAMDKLVRFRSCQAIYHVLTGLPPTAGISEDLADSLCSALIERLQDKVPQVRAQAAKALGRLALADEVCSAVQLQ